MSEKVYTILLYFRTTQTWNHFCKKSFELCCSCPSKYISKAFLNNTKEIDYRPKQPNWEYTMWRFRDFSATQILREINFGTL